MNCWQCGHEMVRHRPHGDITQWECLRCGATWEEPTGLAIPVQDECELDGHSWVVVMREDGDFYTECSHCGLVATEEETD